MCRSRRAMANARGHYSNAQQCGVQPVRTVLQYMAALQTLCNVMMDTSVWPDTVTTDL